MLNSHEQHVLAEVERRLRTEDPAFVTRLGSGQQRLPRARPRARAFRFSQPVIGLLVLAAGLLALGVGAVALLVVVLAVALGWLSGVPGEPRVDAERGER